MPKSAGQRNEDSYRVSADLVALSDGASISYDSRRWARGLVAQYSCSPVFSKEWLDLAIRRFSRRYHREAMPWMKQAAFDRGSFASLLGVQLSRNADGMSVFAVGDSLAVLCDGNRILKSFPYTDADQFEARPQLLSTNPAENAFLDDEGGASLNVFWSFAAVKNPVILCVTDALGQWLLSAEDSEDRVGLIRGLEGASAFANFVEEQRLAGKMRRDDTTLVVIWDARNVVSADR
jgi:hypothetical protein